MKRFPVALLVLAVGVAVSVGQILLLSPLLPPLVASHFGVDGHANGFMSREAFIGSQWGLTVFVAALFFALPALIRVTPDDAVNLPHKDYHLAPERRAATLSYLSDRMYAFGAATLALLASVMQQVYAANIGGKAAIGNATWVFLAAYLIYTGFGHTACCAAFNAPNSLLCIDAPPVNAVY